MKYIVIDGKKYKIDPNDESKPLMGTDGNPIPYEEEEVPPTPPKPKASDYDTMTDEDIAELAKTDPALARLIREKKDLQEQAAERERKAAEERDEQLRKNGEWQKLAEEAEERRKKAEKDRDEATAVLDKYKGTVNTIRDEMLGQIPEDKRGLIPEGSARTQIDYIRKNAKFLGVSLVNKGGNVPPNTDEPPLDEEGKLQKEFGELLAKDNLTHREQERMGEVSRLLKEIKARKQ